MKYSPMENLEMHRKRSSGEIREKASTFNEKREQNYDPATPENIQNIAKYFWWMRQVISGFHQNIFVFWHNLHIFVFVKYSP